MALPEQQPSRASVLWRPRVISGVGLTALLFMCSLAYFLMLTDDRCSRDYQKSTTRSPPVTLWAVQASSYQQKHKNNTTSLSMSCCKLPRDNARTLKASCCAFYGLVSGTVLQDLWSTWNIFDRVSMSNIYQSALSSRSRYSGKCINIVVSSVHHLTASPHNRMFHASLCRMLFPIHSLL